MNEICRQYPTGSIRRCATIPVGLGFAIEVDAVLRAAVL
jgi:hypothetical protein